jgi:hypothetical protein
MALKVKEVDSVPSLRGSRRPQESESLRVVEQARASKTKLVEVRADDAHEAKRFYKAIQLWSTRHPEQEVAVRKEGDAVYVSVDPKRNAQWRGEVRPGRRSPHWLDPLAKEMSKKLTAPASTGPRAAMQPNQRIVYSSGVAEDATRRTQRSTKTR